ncbi:FmdB family zinc ribbon protein [Candidatus Methylobacter favarea]|uniref:FmdB family zinc ribbon protein n=1 Tax=Candidatus Methylobacter favarea TaxID=2707345 RepID=UPI00157D0BCE|nr:zinc ribbon domain-containing protein [Candidatus Methylobacter favarea]
MPIYEYHCQSCGHEHEALQKFSAEPLIYCPACNKPELIKKISAAGFRLKGSGWYETDFKSGSRKNVAGESSSSSTASSTATSPAASSTSKPAACPSGGSCGDH